MRELLPTLVILAALRVHAQPGPSPCPSIQPNVNVYIAYAGMQSGCTPANSVSCWPGEIIQFAAAAYGYDFACAVHTFLWNFGDGTVSNQQSVAHVYPSFGVYPVTLTIATPSQSVSMNTNVTATWLVCSCPAPFVVESLFVNDRRIVRGYSFHRFVGADSEWLWDFGDGTNERSASREVTHVYVRGGLYRVTLSTLDGGLVHSEWVNAPFERRRAARH